MSALGIEALKSPEAFRTISEVATELNVPQHVLRFWESRFSQIKPVKRAGARRYYRPEDVHLLRGIRALLYVDGVTIRGVQKILKERGARQVILIGRGQAPGAFRVPPPVAVAEPVVAKVAVAEKKSDTEKFGPKKRGAHLRAVPAPMSLPFFDAIENDGPAGASVSALAAALAAVPSLMTPPSVMAAAPVVEASKRLAAEERMKLKALLGELEGLKTRLNQVRGI